MNDHNPPAADPRWTLIIVISLGIISLLPRFVELGAIGFQGDEELTAWSALAVAQGREPQMPSGMPYRRALPLTILTAGSIRLLGEDAESSYRVPAALLGMITAPILFLLFRPFTGTTAAIVAALLLALSEWHILVSREARMYAPFLLFYTGAVLQVWRWVDSGTGKYLITGALLFIAAMTLHKLVLLAAILALVPVAVKDTTGTAFVRAMIFCVLAIAVTLLYFNQIVSAPYHAFDSQDVGTATSLNETAGPVRQRLSAILATLPPLAPLLALAGGILGYWFATTRLEGNRLSGTLFRRIAYYTLATLAGILACIGQIYAAFLVALMFFMIDTRARAIRYWKAGIPFGILLAVCVFWTVTALWNYGLHDAAKSLSAYPFPYLAYFAILAPGILLLFLLTAAALVLSGQFDSSFLRASISAAILPMIAIGLAKTWGGSRYLIIAYPFMAVVAAVGLVKFLHYLGRRTGWWKDTGTLILSIAIVLSGVLGTNGIPQAVYAATLGYGKPGYWLGLSFPTNPDHQAAGHFVRERLRDTDIVVAEDVSQQLWYAGRADYWLRKYGDSRRYLYRADDGVLREIYADSKLVTPEVLGELREYKAGRVWVITSGETYWNRKLFLGPEQLEWLAGLEKSGKLVFTGRDSVTRVYCLGCSPAAIDEMRGKGR